MMKTLFVLALLVPSLATATPITLGTWGAMPSVNHDGIPFWDGLSWDEPFVEIGYLIPEAGLEYLHDGLQGPVAFTFTDPVIAWTLLFNDTGRQGGVLGRTPGGAFTYDSGRGVSDSLTTFQQYALFRVLEGLSTRYILGVEDIFAVGDPDYGATDADYNDYVVTFTLANPEQTPAPVPEPTILALFGAGLVGLCHRLKRSKSSRE